ncbi:hypothetical protein UFOVP683_4 [uncultured Caudovirales phage]|uniref:Uncharacterized protein n=1 Tax=uncultured Caudovirales phage TaxID=2100421 RepID=A0A6J5NI42_9CAUD|nr:hypothetical protein UFOVP683_4 [uncultured Caudovirales phage]
MKFDYIKNKLIGLNYNNRDIEILISVKNENLLKKYFFGQGIREYSLLKILKQAIKKPVQVKSKVNTVMPIENDDEEIILEVSVRHDWNGSLSVYGTSYSTYEIRVSREFYENAHRREIERYCQDEIDFTTIEPEEPSDYDNGDSSVHWDNDFQCEIDNIEEI